MRPLLDVSQHFARDRAAERGMTSSTQARGCDRKPNMWGLRCHLGAKGDDESSGIKMIGAIKAGKIIRQNRKRIPIKEFLILSVIGALIAYPVAWFIYELSQTWFSDSLIHKFILLIVIAFPIAFAIGYPWQLAIIKKYNLNRSN